MRVRDGHTVHRELPADVIGDKVTIAIDDDFCHRRGLEMLREQLARADESQGAKKKECTATDDACPLRQSNAIEGG